MSSRVPHTFALLFLLVIAAAVATHVIPAGQFERVERGGRMIVVPDSYARVVSHPAGIADVFLAFPRGLDETAYIVFYIFLIGGAFGVVNATGAVEASINGVVRVCGGRGELVIALLMVLFSLGGATIGMAEETLVFLPGLVVLARRLGYDAVTGGAIALVGAGAGFSGAFLNPFTVGVAQDIAGLPLFSGIGLRLVVWATVTTLSIVYVIAYARRQQRAAQGAQREVPADARDIVMPSTAVRAPADRSAPVATVDDGPGERSKETPPPKQTDKQLGARQSAVMAVLALALAAVVAGTLLWGWGIGELSGLFVAVAVLAGLLGGLGLNGTADRFVAGAAAITGGALVVGLARGVLVIFDGAGVTDTILAGMAGAIQGLPDWAGVSGLYGVQVLLNYFVPSGSGQAALSIPILAPLGDLIGVTRQTSVLAYQFGDGFSNVFTPTQGYFMAGLALIDVSWERWVGFMWRLELLWLAVGLLFLLVAQAIHWGPF